MSAKSIVICAFCLSQGHRRTTLPYTILPGTRNLDPRIRLDMAKGQFSFPFAFLLGRMHQERSPKPSSSGRFLVEGDLRPFHDRDRRSAVIKRIVRERIECQLNGLAPSFRNCSVIRVALRKAARGTGGKGFCLIDAEVEWESD